MPRIARAILTGYPNKTGSVPIIYDALGRTTHSVNYGDNGGSDLTRPATAPEPNTSDNYIVSKTSYDGFGRPKDVTNNLGKITRTLYDTAGRKTHVIENYDNFAVSSGTDTNSGDATDKSKDRVTKWVYNDAGTLSELVAVDPDGNGNTSDNQVTRYVWGFELSDNSWQVVKNGLQVRAEIYPDSDDTVTSSALANGTDTTYDRIEYSFLADGSTATKKDQRGVVREFSYDLAGRLTDDAVTTCPTGVDNSVLRISRTYTQKGQLEKITSHSAATGGTVCNEVQRAYDGYGNITTEWQAVSGAVVTSGASESPKVQYTYDDGATGTEAKYSRLTKMTYPSGREVYYNYDGTIPSALSQVTDIADGVGGTRTKYADYKYRGTGQILKTTHGNGVNLDFTTAGLDRFGRVTDQNWKNSSGTAIDRYTYTYDRGSNRTTRDNELRARYDEDYTYDGLQRLVDVDRNNAAFQSWTLSQTGNWNSFTNQGTTTAKTFNKANEIATIDTSSTQIGFDPAGNMTKMPSAQDSSATRHAVYDAWNRMTACKEDNSGSPGTTIATYSYDGLRRRVRKVVADGPVTHDNYYSAAWQMLEVRKNSDPDPLDQYVWCMRYIDAVAVRFHDDNLDGDYNDGNDTTYYYTNDANMNVTALIDQGAACRGRFAYDAYGKPLFLERDWDIRNPQVSPRANPILYAGYHYDEETGLYNVRHRTYHPTLGRWMQQDILRYVDGMSMYEYSMSSAIDRLDPSGLKVYLVTVPTSMGPEGSRHCVLVIISRESPDKYTLIETTSKSGEQEADKVKEEKTGKLKRDPAGKKMKIKRTGTGISRVQKIEGRMKETYKIVDEKGAEQTRSTPDAYMDKHLRKGEWIAIENSSDYDDKYRKAYEKMQHWDWKPGDNCCHYVRALVLKAGGAWNATPNKGLTFLGDKLEAGPIGKKKAMRAPTTEAGKAEVKNGDPALKQHIKEAKKRAALEKGEEA